MREREAKEELTRAAALLSPVEADRTAATAALSDEALPLHVAALQAALATANADAVRRAAGQRDREFQRMRDQLATAEAAARSRAVDRGLRIICMDRERNDADAVRPHDRMRLMRDPGMLECVPSVRAPVSTTARTLLS